jgi:hypothetical protein
MRTTPTNATTSGRIYLALRAKARKEGRKTDELLLLYALEGFLDRLTASQHANHLVLKGGVLMAAYNLRRPTHDVDLQASHISNDNSSILAMVKAIASIKQDDGLVFDFDAATAETIRTDDEYSGVRVELPCMLATARVGFHVDVNVGDPIWPAPQIVRLSRLLGGAIDISGYPISMIQAEKVVTAIQRGIANTRWRDFADLFLITGQHSIVGEELHRSLVTVADYRKTSLIKLTDALEGFSERAQVRWANWCRKEMLDDRLPLSFADVIKTVIAFADPVITDNVTNKIWNPAIRAWV